MERESIDKLRDVCGTLPNRTVRETTHIYYGCEMLDVELVGEPKNPYKSIFAMATATWGDEAYRNKWKKVSALERYIVVASALQGHTLPTAVESPKYTFIVRGTPRHCFDQMARTRIGAGFGSIGCRDNSKMDSSFILYSEYKDFDNIEDIISFLHDCKRLYGGIIGRGKESYQVARSLLPMSYHHPFAFTQTLLSLFSQAKRRMCFGEEEFICGIHWNIRYIFLKTGMRLIADAMRPACDRVGKCLYAGSKNELFSNLFRGCGRWPSDSTYSEFNKSCTDSKSLSNYAYISDPDEYIDFTLDEEGFEKIGTMDLDLLKEN